MLKMRPEEDEYKIWIRTREFCPGKDVFQWGGRPLSFDECLHELKLLYKEYSNGSFDPWCIGKPMDPESHQDWLTVTCVPLKGNYNFGFNSDYYDHPFFVDGSGGAGLIRELDELAIACTGSRARR